MHLSDPRDVSRYLCISLLLASLLFPFFFFNDTATTEIYTLSLHDALPICFEVVQAQPVDRLHGVAGAAVLERRLLQAARAARSEEHTSELQSPCNLVCRLLLEKKKKHTAEAHVRPLKVVTPVSIADRAATA